MSHFITRLFAGHSSPHAPVVVDRAYVSEFTQFIDHYLDEHPEVIEDQRLGRLIYWDKTVDLTALAQAAKENVPDDAYGFSFPAWCRQMAPWLGR